jgi:arginine deiminase
MTKQPAIEVYSEIGKLKKVLIHRPGLEIENITPELMDRLLFDDIPYLDIARQEHDAFAEIFRRNDIEVVYLEDLAAEAIQTKEVREAFLTEFLAEANIQGEVKKSALKQYFESFEDSKVLIDKLMAGVRKEEVHVTNLKTLADFMDSDYPFLVDPMPNLYFTRDPFATVGTGISLNHMRTVTRQRETLFAKYIFAHHEDYRDSEVKFWYDRTDDYSIEGGDVLVLSDKVLAIGISQRTDAAAIDVFARKLFADGQSFEVILAFDIPKSRAYMHLDTVFTMVDHDKFTIHPEIEGPLNVYSIRKKNSGNLSILKETMELREVLAKYLELEKVTLIRCGGKRGIDAGREQWNDGSNTLAIAPGEVIVYSRNHITNRLLEDQGIKLHVMPSSELSRGRGGPRCMSMPLIRENLIRK